MKLIHGDCVAEMAKMEAESVDAVVCDPPYGLEFMGKEWDNLGDTRQPGDPTLHPSGAGPYDRAKVRHGSAPSYGGIKSVFQQKWHQVWAEEALRVLKPGGHLLAFGGTRTSHRLACAIEDAEFEIRDSLLWLYGTGFPKSLNVSKAIDKAAGAEREVVGQKWADRYPNGPGGVGFHGGPGEYSQIGRGPEMETAPATEAAKQWDGWGTALKPAHEPVVCARKPLIGTVVENVLEHGTGAINIDGCRIETTDSLDGGAYAKDGQGRSQMWGEDAGNSWRRDKGLEYQQPDGRWPANVILSHSPDCGDVCTPCCPIRLLDEQSGNDAGVSRFFYCAKANKRERNAGLIDETNRHPTVKPVAIMRWLVRLVTPPNGLVLDPFMGSGTTGIACVIEGFNFIGIEQDEGYMEIARKRIANAESTPDDYNKKVKKAKKAPKKRGFF